MKNINELYLEWSGKHHTINSGIAVHDSAEAMNFAEYCLRESKPETEPLKYGGEIANFPIEIVKKMLERQFEQTGKKDVSVFEAKKQADVLSGGINWAPTIEGFYFWNAVIDLKNFKLFFEKYPKL